MSYATIDELRSQLGGTPAVDPAYAAKQLHQVPDAPTVKRAEFILSRVKGKRVLEFGASGPMHEAIKKVASEYWGVDRQSGDRVIGADLDDTSDMACFPQPQGYQPEIIVCGEVLEHLGNPQHFLACLRDYNRGVPVIITVPNAHSASGMKQLQGGIENCNRDHVSYYSYRTLLTLVERVGYVVREFCWYNGPPRFAEGLIMVVE